MRAALLLALRTLVREGRSGDLAVLFLALFVAVAALTGVGFLVDRIDRAVELQANEVLGADMRLQSQSPIEDQYAHKAAELGLGTSKVTTMLSVILNGDRTQLANVNAVAPNYPLRGQVQVASQAFGEPMPAQGIPAPGEVWPDSRLLAALDARVGDRITVGALELLVTQVLISRPDQGSGFVDLAPALLMNDADLPATKLIGPGSRVEYAALFAGERRPVGSLLTWVNDKKDPALRVRAVSESSPEINNAATRAGRFLSLASLVSVLLCAVAIAMTARRYVKRHLDLAALLKTLGATRGVVLTISIVQLVCIALMAAAAGAIAGYLVQQGLLSMVKGMIATELPTAGWRPPVMGLAAALLLLTGCALPPILQLARVPAMRVLRRDIGPPPLMTLLAYGPAVLAIGLLIRSVTGDSRMFWGFVVGLGVAVLVLATAGWVLVTLVGRVRAGTAIMWRYGAANLARRRSESILQIVALGLGLSALLLLTIVRGDLLNDWRSRLPQDVPNYFFANIPADERDQFSELLANQGAQLSRLMPMIRGRMVRINGEPISSWLESPSNQQGRGFARRDQNLSWSEDIGAGKVTEGHWFTPEEYGKPLVSVATDYKESLGLKLGDSLTFDIAGEEIEVTISSFREVQWDSLQPNFFLMFAPGLLDDLAGTWMASAQYRPQNPGQIADLVRRFPGVSIFDLDQLIAQVRSIVDKAVIAVQSVFLFTLLAGVVVLLAAVQATRDERRYESAMLRTLGASRRTVLFGVLLEFALLGLSAGLIAAAAAATGARLLATGILNIPYNADPALWVAGGATGALLVCVAGWLATRTALNPPPMQILRQG
jgi:putative ABC transport system permease protein